MKTLLILLAALITQSCATTYHAERTNPDSGTTTVMTVKSYREFPGGIKIDYNRTTGTFFLSAGEVTNGGQAEAMRDVILGVLPLIQPVPGGN